MGIVCTVFITVRCVKEEIDLNKVQTGELEPSFALPIGSAHLNLGDIEQEYDLNNFIYNESDNIFVAVYNDRLFEFMAKELLDVPPQNFNSTFGMPLSTQTGFVAGPIGSQVSIPNSNNFQMTFSNGELIEEIEIKSGTLQMDLNSTFTHDVSLQLSIQSLKSGGVPYQTTLNIPYTGSLPSTNNILLDISGYTIDCTNSGTTTNNINISSLSVVTNSGNGLSGSEVFDYSFGITIDSYSLVTGYFGEYTNILDQDTSHITLFEDLHGGTVHFEDPQINLAISNSAGVDVQTNFSGIWAPENSTNVNIGGAGPGNIPLITGASTPGEVSTVSHTINNANTVPTLSQVMDEGPAEIIYSASATTNPSGFTTNFIMDTSKVWCDAEVVLPLFGYGDNFTLKDTVPGNIEELLGLESDGNINEEDIDEVLLRLNIDNGMPVDVGFQLYFTNDNYMILDSLFASVNGSQEILESASVNFSLPPTHPDYGKVVAPMNKITDVVISNEKLQYLIDNKAVKIIYKIVGNTASAQTGENIKLYPEYSIDIKASAKINMKVDLSE